MESSVWSWPIWSESRAWLHCTRVSDSTTHTHTVCTLRSVTVSDPSSSHVQTLNSFEHSTKFHHINLSIYFLLWNKRMRKLNWLNSKAHACWLNRLKDPKVKIIKKKPLIQSAQDKSSRKTAALQPHSFEYTHLWSPTHSLTHSHRAGPSNHENPRKSQHC